MIEYELNVFASIWIEAGMGERTVLQNKPQHVGGGSECSEYAEVFANVSYPVRVAFASKRNDSLGLASRPPDESAPYWTAKYWMNEWL